MRLIKNDKYILVDKKPTPEPNLLKWARWFETAERVVDKTQIGESKISTVFLGLDHSFSHNGPPVLWETMVFGGKHNQYQDRCAGSWEQAEAMHEKTCDMVRNDL